MKILLNKEIVRKHLIEKEMNIAAAQGLFDFCFYSAENDLQIVNGEVVSEYLDLNLNNSEDKYFYQTRILNAIKEIDAKEYDDNYYRRLIKPKPFTNKEYTLDYLTIKSKQCFPYDDIDIDSDFREVSKIGYFNKPFSYLAVLKNDIVWMSTDPNEINTIRDDINNAKGNVLAFGLGLGYFPIMCAIKDEVKSVTVIEKDPVIIDIFEKHILPLFERKEKIKIIHDDAFNYMKQPLGKMYDYLFIDIWHNPEDGLPLYLRFYRELQNKNIEVHYWLEKSILAMFRRCLLTIVEESLLGYGDSYYKKARNDYDKIINELYLKTKDVVIKEESQLIKLLQDSNLKNLI